jgi:hypothetical protein
MGGLESIGGKHAGEGRAGGAEPMPWAPVDPVDRFLKGSMAEQTIW